MDYLRVPREISLNDIRRNSYSLSPANFRRTELVNAEILQNLLEETPTRGVTTPKLAFIKHSSTVLITNKALQDHLYIVTPSSSGVIPLNPKFFSSPGLRNQDILFSTNVNVGETSLFMGQNPDKLTISPWMVILRPMHKWYVYSFLKHRITKDQMESFVPKGSIFRNAGERYLRKLLIPFPSQSDAKLIINYVSVLIQAIVEKEKAIRDRDAAINYLINEEMKISQKEKSRFSYSYPTLEEIRKQGRLDAVIYDREYKEKIHLILNYKHGTETPTQMGFTVTPGPSLEIKILHTRIDSIVPKAGFYTLILPTNISEFGTMNIIQYLGTRKKLPLLKQGDIVFGEAGFQKGRSIVLVESYENCTTNAHGIYARHSGADLVKSIFFRCIFNWYRNMRLIDIMAVGGSGGHLSPVYFDEFIRVPKFPDYIQQEIAKLYHNPLAPPKEKLTLSNFLDWHHRWNEGLGVWELNREMKILEAKLEDIQSQIIDAKTIHIGLN